METLFAKIAFPDFFYFNTILACIDVLVRISIVLRTHSLTCQGTGSIGGTFILFYVPGTM